MKRIDSLDLKVIELLQEPGAVTPNTTYIAKKLKKPIATMHGRLKRLETKGIIERYSPLINHKKTGSAIMSFILLQAPRGKDINEYAKEVAKIKEIKEVHFLVGEWALICVIRARDMEDYSNIINDIFKKLNPEKMQDIISPKTFKKEI